MKQYITEVRSHQLYAASLDKSTHGLQNAAIADWINSQSGELPELPECDRDERICAQLDELAWSKDAMENYAREAIAAAKGKMGEQEPVAMGSLLQKIMARLADLLDDDKFNEIDGIVTAAGYNYPMPSQQAAQPAPQAQPDQQLCKFYDVETYSGLVAAQSRHIEKLQAKLPPLKDEQPGNPRAA